MQIAGRSGIGPLDPFGNRFAQPLLKQPLFGFGIVFQTEHILDVEGVDDLLAVGRDDGVGDKKLNDKPEAKVNKDQGFADIVSVFVEFAFDVVVLEKDAFKTIQNVGISQITEHKLN